MAPNTYTMQVKCFKESVETPYPEEHNSWTHVPMPPKETHNVYALDDTIIGNAGISSKFGIGKK